MTTNYKSEPFTYDGVNYEVRRGSDGRRALAQVFKDGVPVDLCLTIPIERANECQAATGMNVADELAITAKSDFIHLNFGAGRAKLTVNRQPSF